MQRVFYGLVYGVSLLPLGFLYLFSYPIYFVLYFVVGYRKKIVIKNVKNSFPEKSSEEINKIIKGFYRNFAHYLLETLKSFSISKKEISKRHSYTNLEVLEECKKEGKNVLLMSGHIFNWEWFLSLVLLLPSERSGAIYHKIKNKFWNKKINEMRARFGSIPLNMKESARFMLRTPNDGEFSYLVIADQSPKKTAITYSLKFLNQETPVLIGFDKIVVKKDMAVVFCKTKKIKRGYYKTRLERIYPDAERFEDFEVVHKFYQKLEDTIKENPDNWLWSHKRWKHKKGIDY